MPDLRPGQVYNKGDHEKITVDGVDGETVTGTLADSETGSVAVWVGSPSQLEDLELLIDPNE